MSVVETVGGSRAARTYLRSGLLLTAVMFGGFPVQSLLAGGGSAVPAVPAVLAAVAVVAVHLILVRPSVARADTFRQLVGVASVVVGAGATILVGSTAPGSGTIWFLVPGIGLSALLATRGWRGRDLVATGLLALGVAVLTAATAFPRPAPLYSSLLLGLILVVPPLTDACSIWLIAVLDRLERARLDADELATTRERVRIAAELHDVQGHSLHAIAMHAELTERLALSDPEAAAGHARTVRTLATDALAETRALVRGYRGVDLAGELRNAAGLLRAAGANAGVTGDPTAVPAAHAELLRPVVREAATNVLRHSHPTRVTFTLRRLADRTELEVTNDGVPRAAEATDPHSGTGLAGLRERIGASGGSVEAIPDGAGCWRLRVVLLGAAGSGRAGAAPAGAC